MRESPVTSLSEMTFQRVGKLEAMTRIIAGFAGSQRLRVPRTGTRPTSDRVREAIFSALDARALITGARVLDLYAGSGALGLEAASRGAATVTMVERNRAAADVAQANAAVLRRAAPAPGVQRLKLIVVTKAVQNFLDSSSDEFDLVLIDPPYDLSEDEITAMLTALVPRLAPDSTVVLERSTRNLEPLWPEGLLAQRRKDYGETTLWWAMANNLS